MIMIIFLKKETQFLLDDKVSRFARDRQGVRRHQLLRRFDRVRSGQRVDSRND